MIGNTLENKQKTYFSVVLQIRMWIANPDPDLQNHNSDLNYDFWSHNSDPRH